MKKYFVWNGNIENREETDFEYEIGETIRVNSVDTYKCIKKEYVNGELLQYFKKGIVTFNY